MYNNKILNYFIFVLIFTQNLCKFFYLLFMHERATKDSQDNNNIVKKRISLVALRNKKTTNGHLKMDRRLDILR